MLLFLVCCVLLPQRVSAQEQSSFFADTIKGVLFDPTTYAPAVIAYDATLRDWNSSQPFFRNGYVEHNERFTISGRPNDVAVSYRVGRSRILRDAIVNLEMSAANNAVGRVVERMLIERYPTHRKLVKTLGWIERAALASTLSYYLSAQHYRQAAENATRAQQMGLR
jgi:hypothetical protein